MAVSERLYEELAKALAQPSDLSRSFKEASGIPFAVMQGYETGAQFNDAQRKRKLEQQTLADALQNQDLATGIRNFTAQQGDIQKQNVMSEILLQKSSHADSPWGVVPGMMTKDNKPLQQNRETGEVRPVDLTVAPTTHAMPGFPDIEWDTATDSNKALGKAVYEGRIRPSDMGTRDRGMAVKLANEYARQGNLPPLKSYQAEVSGKTANAFATGKPGMNVLALNTALGHTKDALDAYTAVANTDARMLNKPLNISRAQTNDPNIIKLQTTLGALSGELATVFKGTGGTDQEIAHWHNILSQDLTPSQANAVIPQVRSLLNSRLSSLEYQRTSGMSGRSEMPLLSPTGKEIMGNQEQSFGKTFATEEEANASGYKGPATIAGRKAVLH